MLRSAHPFRRRLALVGATAGALWIVGPGVGSALAAAPVCNDNSYTVENTDTLPLPVTANCSDADLDPMSASVNDFPDHGSLTPDGAGGGVYHPNSGYVGPDSFSFHAVANSESSNVVTISITVTGTAGAQPPVCFGPTTLQAYEGEVTSFFPSCFDPDTPPNALTATVVDQGDHGVATIGANSSYAADDGYVGPDSFSFKVSDGTSDSNTVVVAVDVLDFPEGNQPPTCPESHAFVEKNDPVGVVLKANCVDPEGDSIFYNLASPSVQHGTICCFTSTSVVYKPTPGYTGPDALGYSADDPFHPPVNFVVEISVLEDIGDCCESAPEATPAEPYAASIDSPVEGPIYIDTRETTGVAPTGYTFLDQEWDITAPDAIDADEPLTFVFKLDASELAAASLDPEDVVLFRDGAPVDPPCPPVGSRTDPDWWPCEDAREIRGDGDVWITVLTMEASTWNAGVSDVQDADGDGIADDVDNCVNAANANQKDYNQNGRGDACDPVTPSGICRLTHAFVSSSAKYARLSAKQKAATDRLAAALCNVIDEWAARLKPRQKEAIVAAYKLGVSALKLTGWLTQTQAATLKSAADDL